MELTPRLLAFLEHEMEQIKDDRDRRAEDRKHASSVLGRIEGEIAWEKKQHKNDDVNTSELLS
jgi:hypothetical protein